MPKNVSTPLSTRIAQFTVVLVMSFSVASVCALPASAITLSAIQVSPSPVAASPSDEVATQNLKERIDTVLKSKTDQVKGVINEMTLKKRGFIGEVERVIEKTVTVKTLKDSEVVILDPSVVVIKDNKKATIDDLAVGDWVIALGYDDGQTFTLRRLVVSSTTLLPKKFDTVIGAAQTVTKTQLTLASSSGGNQTQYQLNKTTHVENDQGKILKLSDIKKDTQYLVISYTDKDQKIAAFIKSLAASVSE